MNVPGASELDTSPDTRPAKPGPCRTVGGELSGGAGMLAEDPVNASVGGQKRMIELFLAQNELDAGGIGRARGLVGGCAQDWRGKFGDEVPAFCSILAARIALLRGDRTGARRIMADQRLDEWLTLRTLSPTWRLDFPAECRELPDASLCS